MSTLKNKVQLIGNVGNEPEITRLDSGKEVALEGKLTSRSYETTEGEKRYVTEVVAREMLLMGSKGDVNTLK